MHRILKKEQVLTIPNLLSVFRLLLIPVIVWLYCVRQEYKTAVCVLILSGITDIADGIIARTFHMVSDFGKILDPIADKLTQAAVLVCLTFRYRLMLLAIALFVVKEVCMGVISLITVKRTDTVNSSRWYGKVNTVILYVAMVLLILFQGMPEVVANLLILVCCISLVGSFALYALFYKNILFQ